MYKGVYKIKSSKELNIDLEILIDVINSLDDKNLMPSIILINPKYFREMAKRGLGSRLEKSYGMDLYIHDWEGVPILFTNFVKDFYFVFDRHWYECRDLEDIDLNEHILEDKA